MTTKLQPSGTPGSASQISLVDQLLSTRISLPSNPAVSYILFAADDNNSTHNASESIETARRLVLSQNTPSTLLDSSLTSVHIGSTSFLYVFRISDNELATQTASSLAALRFDGLNVVKSSSFRLANLFPCSQACSAQELPCSNCKDATSPVAAKSSSPATLFPRKPLQTVYSHFLEAVRIRLLDDIAKAATINTSRRHVKRLKGGFLLGPSVPSSEWTSSWEYRTLSRPLLYCQLQLHVSWQAQSGLPALIVHPLLQPTHYLPLAYTLPMSSGSPITLLPQGTPAYFLTHYSGPTSALQKQFQESLQGLGVAGWEASSDKASPTINGLSSTPEYIIAWIKVENKQGEDKGIVAIYPTALCLSFLPSSTTRPMLEYIPELPSPLQPSPLLSAAVVATASRAQSTTSPVDGSARPSPTTSAPPASAYPTIQSHPWLSQPRPILPSSPTCDSLQAFRCLTLSKSKDIRTVADKVSGYVDAIAKERDRERERLKRERETGVSSSPRLAKNASSASSQTLTAASSTPPTSLPVQSQTTPSATNNPASTSLLTTPLTNMHQQTPIAATTSQMSTPGQNFYPSPPHAEHSIVPPSGAMVSPTTDTAPSLPSTGQAAPEKAPDANTSTAPPPQSVPAPVYGPYNNIENSWQSQPYLGMDMDIDFDMGMDTGFDMDAGPSAGRGGDDVFGTSDNGMDFDTAFTDDDFNFFDGPIAPAQPRSGAAAGSSHENTLTGSQAAVGSQFAQGIASSFVIPSSSPTFPSDHLSGPTPGGQVPPTPQSHTLTSPSPWVNSVTSPGFGDHGHSGQGEHHIRSDLFPLSPGQTPSTMHTHSVPATPQVSVHLRPHRPMIRRTSTGGTNFDAILFSEYHREMDGKYAVGKFSLPSPPPEDDEDKIPAWPWPPPPPSSSSSNSLGSPFPYKSLKVGGAVQNSKDGWRARYMAVTDPRIGVMKKLIGVKRKLAPEPNSRETGRNVQASPSWIREWEDWQQDPSDADTPEAIPDDDSDDESLDELLEESPAFSRPSTPLPHYLPPGPSLLHTHFQHGVLLPLSKPLRPPGAAVAPTNIAASAAAAAFVPTPMSPAAGLGAANERSKSVEAAAYTVAREVVENPPWAEAWRASGSMSELQVPNAEIWPIDVRIAASLISSVPGCEGPLQLGDLFGISSKKPAIAAASGTNPPEDTSQKNLQRMEPPLITVAKGDAIMYILPTAVRFWEKIGIGPRGGKKDGIVFALFEDDGGQRQAQVENWMSRVTSTWERQHLGVLTPGKSSHCSKDGLMPIRFGSSFWKSLASCIAGIPSLNGSLIFFVVTPLSTMSLASPILRQVFSAIKKALKTYSEARIHFQLIPEGLLHGNHSNPAAAFSDTELVCYSLYDRILVPVDRTMSRRLYDYGERVRKYFQEPIVTLAREKYVKAEVEFKRRQDVHLDVLEKGLLLHVGYTISECGKWVLVACVDQRGEAHELGLWLAAGETEATDGNSSTDIGEPKREGNLAPTREHLLVKRIWDFAVAFSQKANIEWRIVVSRLGVMSEAELNAWANLLEDSRLIHGPPHLHVSVLSAQQDAPWTLCNPVTPPGPVKQTPSKTSSSGISRSSAMILTSNKSHPNQPQNVFTDITSTVYTVPSYAHLPQTLPMSPHGLGLDLGYIPEDENASYSSTTPLSSPVLQSWNLDAIHQPHPIPLRPQLSSTMICVLANSNSATSNVSMLHLHLLYTTDDHTSSTDQRALQDSIVKNFHDLSILAALRWRLGPSFMNQCNGPAKSRGRAYLPFHLGAVNAMKDALGRDNAFEDSTSGGLGVGEGEGGEI